jgi:peroxisomal trans-2-enoyl-CoA reductase
MFAPGLFAEQVCIVTGGGSGIGLRTAKELRQLGARVAICGRTEAKLEAAATAIAEVPSSMGADGVYAAPCDIREPDQIAAYVAAVQERFGRIDVLVNNAGGQFPSPAENLSPNGWAAVVRNNLNGSFFMTREVATSVMIPARRGRIVMVTAMVARGFPGMSHTGAARAGVENLTCSLAVEWAQHHIKVNCVAPGNNILSSGTAQYGEGAMELARQATPARRLGSVDDVAKVIVFLASDQNDFVTGSVFRVDGGQALWGDIWPIPDPLPSPPMET